ncbi:hypothetical protein CEXT_231831 [Caerostris extrusa]|uniref:C2H2-type domain-containing protein n=1 Tax=Caerostris extrusa TaxID=172846 RepID=A0AAV4SEC1_CAEEX|nr:hypothetical protein CEXT_231831 [Caerostris extrusa]
MRCIIKLNRVYQWKISSSSNGKLTIYCCPVCSFSTDSAASLKTHLFIHQTDHYFICFSAMKIIPFTGSMDVAECDDYFVKTVSSAGCVKYVCRFCEYSSQNKFHVKGMQLFTQGIVNTIVICAKNPLLRR